MEQLLEIKQLSIRHGRQWLCRELTFSVAAGEVLTIMGPSGSGKSTLLSWVSGALPAAFEASGEILLGGRTMTGLPIEDRRIAILFQDDLLFPHMTVSENLLFAVPSGCADSRRATVDRALGQVGLAGFEKRLPAALSGGQKARISLMRALLSRPKAILLDEPFSKLDKPLRRDFRRRVFDEISQMAIPALLVTHDEDDIPDSGRVIHLPATNTTTTTP
jgi:putative thiamine transport system ATP-binding protein